MNEGANCIASEIIQAGFSMFSCRIGQGTEKPGEPHQNRCTVFDEGGSYKLVSMCGGVQDPALLTMVHSLRFELRTPRLSSECSPPKVDTQSYPAHILAGTRLS